MKKNAPGNRSDIGWKYGKDIENTGRKVECNYCHKVINGGIFRFKHHLAGSNKDVLACTHVNEEVKLQMMNIVVEMEGAASKKSN